MTLGLVVGKFYPPHRGHAHLIRSARARCDHLVVICAHHPSQQIPGELRAAWLREIHPDCDVRLVPDELDDDSQQWAAWTLNYLGRPPDVVFSSEDYGPVFARLMGARHEMIDRGRAAVPTSGTAVRAAPLDHLDLLEPCVRAHYVLRVVLIGAESTGKTTLARLLAAHYKTAWVPEYGREHWEAKVAGLSADDVLRSPPGWTDEEFVAIAAEQQRREDAAARSADRVVICDTNAFATGTWFERYRVGCNLRLDAIGARDRVDLYLLTAPDIPFVQDGVRDGEAIRGWMHGRFAEQLRGTAAPAVELRGPIEARMERATRAIDAAIAAARPGILRVPPASGRGGGVGG